MSFINKSVNFSQTDMLKRDYLAPLLEKYNIHMLIYGMYDKGIVMSLESQMSDMLIPNNNKKMYLYINNKNILDGGNTNTSLNSITNYKPDIDNSVNSVNLYSTLHLPSQVEYWKQ